MIVMKRYIIILLLPLLLACDRNEKVPVSIDYSYSPQEPSTIDNIIMDGDLTGPVNLDTTEYVYRWDWNSDGEFDTKFSAQPRIGKIFNEPGEYSVTLEALHISGESYTMTHSLVINQGYSAPTPDFKIRPDSGNFKTLFTFDASASFDDQEEQKHLTFRWDFDQDNQWDTTAIGDPIAYHRFDQHGLHPVKLLISDTTNRHSELVKMVLVNQLDTLIRPVIRIEPEYPSDTDTIRIIATDSYYEGKPEMTLLYSFKPFAGLWTDPSSHGVNTWILPPPGIFNIKVRVYSDEGLFKEGEVELVVSRANRKPTAKILKNMRFGNILSSFEFNAWESSDVENTPSELKARWDFEGDGVWDTQFSFEKIIRRVYQDPGKYDITLQILDKEGLRDVISTDIHVSPHTNPMSYFVDVRDEQDYGMVQIADSWWMGENLNFQPRKKVGPGKTITWCYDDNSAICDVLGKLYFGQTIGIEYNGADDDNICPRGWHLPSRAEWTDLILEYGFEMGGKELFYGGRSDFNALLGGYAAYYNYGGFEEFEADSIYKVAYFLTSDINTSSATTVQIIRNDNEVRFREMPAEGYYSVRCIRDE